MCLNKNQLIKKLEEYKNNEVIQYLISLSSTDSQIYFSGGFVRDLAAGFDISVVDDIDLITFDINCEDIAKKISQKFNGTFAQTDANVFRVFIDGMPALDLAEYNSAEHSIDKLLSRKDYTINAFAYNIINNQFFDNYNALEDCNNRKLKLINDDYFKNIPEAILRGFRFCGKLGFEFDKNTAQIINRDKNHLVNMPVHSIRHNLIHMCKLKKGSAKALSCIFDYDCLKEVFPEFYNKNSIINHDDLTAKIYNNSVFVVEVIEFFIEHISDELKNKFNDELLNDVPYYALMKIAALFNNLAQINPVVTKENRFAFAETKADYAIHSKNIFKRLEAHNHISDYVAALIHQYRYAKLLLNIDKTNLLQMNSAFSQRFKNIYADILFFTMANELAFASDDENESIFNFYSTLMNESVSQNVN